MAAIVSLEVAPVPLNEATDGGGGTGPPTHVQDAAPTQLSVQRCRGSSIDRIGIAQDHLTQLSFGRLQLAAQYTQMFA